MLDIKKINKKFSNSQVLFDVDFKVDKGEIIGFLGPNGAGKTTLMKIITGYLYPHSGDVLIDKKSVFKDDKLKNYIGYLPEANPLYEDMGVDEFLNYTCELKGIKNKKKEIDRVIELAGLNSKRNKIINTLSKGYRQRTGLASALIGDPKILILDEPTEGLDPTQRDEIKNLIIKLGKSKTILISSHVLNEISSIVNRVLIISNGKIMLDDKIDNIMMMQEGKMKLNILYTGRFPEKKLKEKFDIDRFEKSSVDKLNKIEFQTDKDIRKQLFEHLKDTIIIYEFYSEKIKLEDVFFQTISK